MAQAGFTPISLYYSTTAAAAPTAGNLVPGELAINITDGKLYYEDNLGAVQLLAAGSGALGDVVGPATATANAIPTFNGTTGKLIQNNSGVTISAGIITATGFSGPLNGSVGATTANTGVFTQVEITAQGDLRLQDTTGGEYVALQAPGTLASSYTLTMPPDDGNNGQVLTTNGSGVLSWANSSGGDVTGPASATDDAVVRFDGTTGKLIQNSAVTIADTTGNITGGTYNKVTITAPASGSTLTVADGKTLTANSTLTLAGTDAKTLTVNASLTLSGTDSTVMTFPATSTTVAGLGIAQTFTQDQTIAGNLTLNGQGDVRFADGDSSNWVAFQGAANITSNVTWTLPAADGSNGQVLSTDGTGALSWITPSSGTSITISNDTSTASDLYPSFFSATSGTASTVFTSNAKLLYKPSTGEFKSEVPIALNGIFVNAQTIDTNYTIGTGYNGMSSGPVTVASGVTVTVDSGSNWAVSPPGGGGITTGKSIAMAMIFGF